MKIIIIIIRMKKKNLEQNCFWATAQVYCEIVLQGRLKGKDFVLQYSLCIAEI